MLIEKDDDYLITGHRDLEEIRDFLKENRNNPKIPRKTIDELYSIYIVLFFLYDSEYFSLPIDIRKSDPPDFVLEELKRGYKKGIEVVSSGTQIEKHAFNKMTKEFPTGSILEKPYYVLGSDIDLDNEDKNKIKNGIRKPDEKLTSDGFGNLGEEKAWLDCIYKCLNAKILKLNKEHFPKYHSNQLIIYDDSGYFAEPDYIFPKLRKEYKFSHKISFDSVYILMNCCHLFIADVFGKYISFNIPHDLI